MTRLELAQMVALAVLTPGCVHPYLAPTPEQPHALLKVRRTYQALAGTNLREGLSVEGHAAFTALVPRDAAGAPRSDVILIHPTPASLRVGSMFLHYETRLVNESYSVQVPYTTTESYSCGSGTHSQSCSRSVTHYRTEWRTRSVYRTVEVSDGSCASSVWISPRVGGEYLLNYDYAENTVCHLACFEQIRTGAPGTFETKRCPEPTPAEMQKLLDDR